MHLIFPCPSSPSYTRQQRTHGRQWDWTGLAWIAPAESFIQSFATAGFLVLSLLQCGTLIYTLTPAPTCFLFPQYPPVSRRFPSLFEALRHIPSTVRLRCSSRVVDVSQLPRSESFGQCIVVALKNAIIEYFQILVFDIQATEECVLECFKPGMTVWDIENLFSEYFKPGMAV